MKDKNVSSLVVADEKGKPQAIVSKEIWFEVLSL
jgi:hypothetical protein